MLTKDVIFVCVSFGKWSITLLYISIRKAFMIYLHCVPKYYIFQIWNFLPRKLEPKAILDNIIIIIKSFKEDGKV